VLIPEIVVVEATTWNSRCNVHRGDHSGTVDSDDSVKNKR
jgi:hypothetical protein